MLHSVSVPEAFSRSQALKAVGLTEKQVKQWERSGLLDPLESYAFKDLVPLRTLAKLQSKKLPPKRIAEILSTLKSRIDGDSNPLSELKLTPEGSRIRVHLGGVEMDAFSGQLLLDFADAQARQLVELPVQRESARDVARKRGEAEYWFQKAVEFEQSGTRTNQALDAYLVALALDPTLTAAMVNMGTLHFTERRFGEAEKYYQMAVETNPKYPLAQFNLGNLYDELGRPREALEHYLVALQLDPNYADAHYNAALVYQSSGEVMKAIRHWRTYLKLDPAGHWSDLARNELRKLYQANVHPGAKDRARAAGAE